MYHGSGSTCWFHVGELLKSKVCTEANKQKLTENEADKQKLTENEANKQKLTEN